MTLELCLLAAAAFLAGLVDAIAGGGGLVQLPALLAVFPEAPVATLFGTNKGASIWGTAIAASQYLRRVAPCWPLLRGALPAALVASWWGARSVAALPTALVRPAVLAGLVAVAVYTFMHRDLGAASGPRWRPQQLHWLGVLLGGAIGFYDGIFGPGTGTFLMFALVRFFGHDFLQASAHAKLINLVTNLGALACFVGEGHFWWQAALSMAVANMAGAMTGSRLALRGGAVLVRRVFLCVVVMLVAKLGVDLFLSSAAR